MSIKLSQINESELNTFVDTRITRALDAVSDSLSNVQVGDTLTFTGSPPVWTNTPFPEIKDVRVGEGLVSGIGSPSSVTTFSVGSTVVRTNTRNQFTLPVSGKANAGVVFSSGAPGFIFNELGADKDEGVYRFYSQNGSLFFDIRNDANSLSKNWLLVTRTGAGIDNVDFQATSVSVNNEAVITRAEFDRVVKTLGDRITALGG